MGCLDAVAPCLRRNRVNGWHSNRCTNGHSLGLGRPVLCTACHHNDHDDHNSVYDDYFNYNDYFDNFNNFNYDLNYNYNGTGVALTR